MHVASAAGYGGTVPLSTLASWVATIVPRSTGSLEFDEDVFRDAYADVERAIRSATMRETVTAVLVGIDPQSVPFDFSETVHVDHLGERELAMALEAGFLPTHAGRAWSNGILALRVTRDWPKVFGDPDHPPQQPAGVVAANELIAHAITALRLHAPGRVSHSGIVSFGGYVLGGGSSYVPGEAQREWGINYRIDLAHGDEIRELWLALQSDRVTNDHALQTALRRFNYSAERRVPEDQILDLLIAAEAVLLADQSDPFTRGELTYRLSIRAARLLRGDRDSRRAMQREWAQSYAARSAIAHGASAEDFSRRLKATPEQLVRATEANVRETLRSILLRRAKGEQIDWDEIVLA